MIKKSNLSERIGMIAVHIVLILFSLSIILAFMNVIAISLSGKTYVMRGNVTFIPKGLNFEAYKLIIKKDAVWRSYANTLFVVLVGTPLQVLLTCFAAFPLSRDDLVGKKFITIMLVFTMWFSAGMIPLFVLVKSLKLYNTLWSLIIPAVISAYYVIIVRNFFREIPSTLEDSARIDGCNDARVLFQIYLPLSKPVLATISLWVAVKYWNNYIYALLYIRNPKLYTLQVVLRNIVLTGSDISGEVLSAQENDEELLSDCIKYAAIIVTTLPIMCVYPFLQKYFVKGVIVGAVKG